MVKISKGLELPIKGKPLAQIDEKSKVCSEVAVVGPDYIGLKPTMKVKIGEQVKKGQILFSDKKNAGVLFTAPAAGEVSEINRGEKRALQSVVIKVKGDEKENFSSYKGRDIQAYGEGDFFQLLIESGLWNAFRTRPYSKTPPIDSKPQALFINLCDTKPLAADPSIVIDAEKDSFLLGLEAISQAFDCPIHLAQGKKIVENYGLSESGHVKIHQFVGVHPAGNVGTHIHFVFGASDKRIAWHLDYQDVIAIGHLLNTGELKTDRIISLAGPRVGNPRLIRVPIGGNIKEICENELLDYDELRILSGSVFGGRDTGKTGLGFLGRYDSLISVLAEGRAREFLGWHAPGLNKFSVTKAFLGHLFPNKRFDFTTTTSGSPRAIVPIGNYEKVVPLDIEPTFLLRALCSGNSDMAQKLGCLELDEEDLALCSFVDPGKHDFGKMLRSSLDLIEKEG